jgi:Ran GTPase-activating protein (RanGAP) involved in mRNA processing and transport
MQNQDKENKWLQEAYCDTSPVTFSLITDQNIKLPILKTLRLIQGFFTNHTTITHLIIRGNNINKLVMDTLMASLKQLPLTYLDLSNNKIDHDTIKIFSCLLNELTYLRCLKLDRNCIADQGILALSSELNNAKLRELSLASNNIQDGIIALSASLEKHSTLTKLSLPGNSINQAGAKGLCSVITNNPHIMYLDLSNNKLGPIEAKMLAEGLGLNTSIKTLYLSYNNIGDEGALSISHLVRNNTILTCLDIRSNAIGVKGGTLLVSALKENKTIKDLNLSQNPLGNMSTNLLKEINELVSNNLQIPHQIALKLFVYTMIILARIARNPSPNSPASSFWSLLPTDIKDLIIDRVCKHFSHNTQLRKSNIQLYQCARFIVENIVAINQKIHAEEPIHILEQRKMDTYRFTFFKISSDSPQLASHLSAMESVNQANTHKL